MQEGISTEGGTRLHKAVSDALAVHSASLVTDALGAPLCSLTPSQAGPGLQNYLDALLTQPPGSPHMHVIASLANFAGISCYTGNAIKVELPSVPGCSNSAVKAALKQLTCGHLAGAIAKEVLLHLMRSGVLRFAAQLAGETCSTSAGSAGRVATEIALEFLFFTAVMISDLPPALLPVTALDAHLSEVLVLVLDASLRMLVQLGSRPSAKWVQAFCSLTRVLSENEGITIMREATLFNVLLTMTQDACSKVDVTPATTEAQLQPVMYAIFKFVPNDLVSRKTSFEMLDCCALWM